MKKNAKILALLTALALFTAGLTGCGNSIDNSGSSEATTTSASTTKVTTEATTTEATTTEKKEETTTSKTTTAAKTTVAPKTTTTKATTAKTTTAKVTTTAKATTTPAPAPAASGVGKYFYNTLNDDEKVAYDEIVDAVKNFNDTVTITPNLSGAQIEKVYQGVFFQEPALISFLGQTHSFSDGQTSLPLSYRYSQDETAKLQANLDSVMNSIKSKFPANASAYDKLKVLHDYIIPRTGFSKDGPYAKCAYGPLVDGTSQCEGYAKAVSYFCNEVGIESVRITGNNDQGLSHAWNKVLVNGQWYNIDFTWDDPEGISDPNYMLYSHFLVPDMLINGLSHFVDTSFTPPAANAIDMNYFVRSGLYANTVEEAEQMMQRQIINSAKNGQQPCQVMTRDADVFNAAYDSIMNGGKCFTFKDTANGTAGCTPIQSISDFSNSKMNMLQINLAY